MREIRRLAKRSTRQLWRPAVAALAGAVVALVLSGLDRLVELPLDQTIPIASARSLMVAVASTMVTATVVVFWIRGMLVSTRSSTFPARVLGDYLDDPDQQWLMGGMVGVFVVASITTLEIPGSDETNASVPTLSILAVVVATVVALLAIILSVSTGRDYLNEQRVLRRIVDRTLATIDRDYPEEESGDSEPDDDHLDETKAIAVRSQRLGWLRSVDEQGVLQELPEGAVCLRVARLGSLVSPGQRLCLLWGDGVTECSDAVERKFEVAETSTSGDDIASGIRNLVDIILAGVSDTSDRTSAHEAILHLGAVLRPLIVRAGPPHGWTDDLGRRMIRTSSADYAEYVHDTLEDLDEAIRSRRTRELLTGLIDGLIDAAESCGRSDRAALMRDYANRLSLDPDVAE